MDSVSRKVANRMYPSPSQEAALLDLLGMHQRLYNAALEQRIAAWQRTRTSVGFANQCTDLTELRAADETYAGLNAQSSQVTLKRVDLAFAAFFRRCKTGETPGFPRFKSLARFSGWGYKAHGDGFRFTPGDGRQSRKHRVLQLSGIGAIKVRGRARTPGDVKTCEIQHKDGCWYASGNPRFVRNAATKLEEAQQALSLKKRASKNRAKAKIVIATIHRKTVNRRRDFLHKSSAKVVAAASLIATETLTVKNMTRSAKGTIEEPGRNVAQKAGLNREILSTAPAAYLKMLRYKCGRSRIALCQRSDAPGQAISDMLGLR